MPPFLFLAIASSAMDMTGPWEQAMTAKKGGILAALRRSPLVEAGLDLTRPSEMESILKSRRVW